MKTHVMFISPEATLRQAADLMDLYQVSSLPVVDNAGRLCGILSESDVFRFLDFAEHLSLPVSSPSVSRVVNEGSSDGMLISPIEKGDCQVSFCMTTPVISVTERSAAHVALETMLRHHVKRLPVLDEEERVVGMLNRIDLIQAFFEASL